jgi:hypothetical protein
MGKTITLRLENDIYNIFKKAADGDKRTISNFLEYAALSFLSNEAFVSDTEMEEILNDKNLIRELKKGEKEIEEGKYKIVS